MKVFLCILAGVLLAAGIINFLVGTTVPLNRLTLTKEALDQAPERADGYKIVFKASEDPSGSHLVVPEGSPGAIRSIWTGLLRNVSRMNLWLNQETIQPKAETTGRGVPHGQALIKTNRDLSIHFEHGIVGVPAGTQLAVVAKQGASVQVRDGYGATFVIPISATDMK